MSPWAVVLVALALLAGAYPYVKYAKHSDSRTLAAYLVFVGVFALAAALLYTIVAAALIAANLDDALESAGGGVLFVAVIFVPAFLLARWQLKRPPHRPMMPR